MFIKKPKTITNVNDWGISKTVIGFLMDDLELLRWLSQERNKKPFPPNYRPDTIELLSNGICQIRAIGGQIVYFNPISEQVLPGFIEIRFDTEIAMLLIRGEIVIDRTNNNSQLAQLLCSTLPATTVSNSQPQTSTPTPVNL